MKLSDLEMSKQQRWSRHTLPSYEDGHAPEVEVIFRDNDNLEHEERAAKRRRIERHAENYLRGGTLLLQSASLKGPLETWRNPWRSRGTEVGELQVPPQIIALETTVPATPVTASSVSKQAIRSTQHSCKQTKISYEIEASNGNILNNPSRNDTGKRSKSRHSSRDQYDDRFSGAGRSSIRRAAAMPNMPTIRDQISQHGHGDRFGHDKVDSSIMNDVRPAATRKHPDEARADLKVSAETSANDMKKVVRQRRLRTPTPTLQRVEILDVNFSSPLSEVDFSRLPADSQLDTPQSSASRRHIQVEATNPLDLPAESSFGPDDRVGETHYAGYASMDLVWAAVNGLDVLSSQEKLGSNDGNSSPGRQLLQESFRDSVTEKEIVPVVDALIQQSTPEEYGLPGTDESAMLKFAQTVSDLHHKKEVDQNLSRSTDDQLTSKNSHTQQFATAPQEQSRHQTSVDIYDMPPTPDSDRFSNQASSVFGKEHSTLEELESGRRTQDLSIPEHQDSKAYSTLTFGSIFKTSGQQSIDSIETTDSQESSRKRIPRFADIRSPKRVSALPVSTFSQQSATRSKSRKQTTFGGSGWTLSKPVSTSDENKDPSQNNIRVTGRNIPRTSPAPSQSIADQETILPRSIMKQRSSMKELNSLTQSNTQAFKEMAASTTFSSVQFTAPAIVPASYQMGQRMFSTEDEAEEDKDASVDDLLDSMSSFLQVDYRF